MSSAAHGSVSARPCPRCGDSTTALKAYRLPTFLLFLFIAVSFRHGLVVACPRCMRKELLRLAAINLLPANLLWFVLLLPWYGIAAIRSTTAGHSSAAAGALLHSPEAAEPAFSTPVQERLEPMAPGQKRLSAQAVKRWCWAFVAVTVAAMLAVGALGAQRESDGVEAALLASFPVGFFRGAWRGAVFVRRAGSPRALVLAVGVAGGVLVGAAVAVFFLVIFPVL